MIQEDKHGLDSARMKRDLRVKMKDLLSKYQGDGVYPSNTFLLDNLHNFIISKKIKDRAALLLFVPAFKGEPDLLSDSRLSGLSKFDSYCPRCDELGEMHFYRFPCELFEGRYGIREPGADESRLFKIDHYQQVFCVIPGLAFDCRGGRLGRGKGFYDRFLNNISPERVETVKIGVCWSFQLIESIPVEKHDQRVDCVITEDRVLLFSED